MIFSINYISKMMGVWLAVSLCLYSLVAQSAELSVANLPVSSPIVLSPNFTPPQNFRNINLLRTINLEKSFPRETINVVIENVADSAQDEYYLPFTPEEIKSVGAIEATDRNNIHHGILNVQAIQVDIERKVQFYRIKLPEPLAPKSQSTLRISYSYISSLTPKPAAIPQAGEQFLEYKLSAFARSSYDTLNQKTEIKFTNSNVPNYTKIPQTDHITESPTKTGNRLTYGPFGNVRADTIKPVKVRYQFTKPLIHVSKLERNIEISHWGGNIAFEERYNLLNQAANLSKLFSRVEWASTVYYNPPTTAIKELKIPMRSGSLSPYYVDIIGNVSTSRFRSSRHEANLEIKPRYPVFGGWKYPFHIGWDADLKKFLRKLNTKDGYVLNVAFFEGPKQGDGIEYESIQVCIILPEGAKNVNYSTTVPLASATLSLHKTYMDTIGRTTLNLTANNIFDSQRGMELIVTYDHSFIAALRKPLVFFSGFLSLFVAAWMLCSLDVSIRSK